VRVLGFLIIVSGIIAIALVYFDVLGTLTGPGSVEHGQGEATSDAPEPRPTATPEPEVAAGADISPEPVPQPLGPATPAPVQTGQGTGEMVELPPVRDVTPEEMTAGPKVIGPTVRLPGPVAPAPKPRKRRFFRVIVSDAGTILADKVTIKIAGIATPDLKKTCTDAKNREWPCGLVARTALRRLIRIRAIECVSNPIEAPATVALDCSVGKTNLAEWLVAQGWAEPNGDGGALADELEEAKAAKRGMWR